MPLTLDALPPPPPPPEDLLPPPQPASTATAARATRNEVLRFVIVRGPFGSSTGVGAERSAVGALAQSPQAPHNGSGDDTRRWPRDESTRRHPHFSRRRPLTSLLVR